MTTVEEILDRLQRVMHPEVKRSLVELGMIKDVTAADGTIRITLAMPFKDVPVKDDLKRSLQEAVAAGSITIYNAGRCSPSVRLRAISNVTVKKDLLLGVNR